MPGKICIITATGMICEAASSYERHYPIGSGRKGSKKTCEFIDVKTPRGIEKRVEMLLELAGVTDTPFMIVPKL